MVILPLVLLERVDNPQYLFLEAIQKGVGCFPKLVVFLTFQVVQLCQLSLDLLVAHPKHIRGDVFLNIMT